MKEKRRPLIVAGALFILALAGLVATSVTVFAGDQKEMTSCVVKESESMGLIVCPKGEPVPDKIKQKLPARARERFGQEIKTSESTIPTDELMASVKPLALPASPDSTKTTLGAERVWFYCERDVRCNILGTLHGIGNVWVDYYMSGTFLGADVAYCGNSTGCDFYTYYNPNSSQYVSWGDLESYVPWVEVWDCWCSDDYEGPPYDCEW